jgi:hypothetical protein
MNRKCAFFIAAVFAVGSAVGRQSPEEQTSAHKVPDVVVNPIPSPDITGAAESVVRLPKIEKVGETPSIPAGDPQSRAWSTSMGWHPGGSAFPEASTHEARLTLLSVGGKRMSWFKAGTP